MCAQDNEACAVGRMFSLNVGGTMVPNGGLCDDHFLHAVPAVLFDGVTAGSKPELPEYRRC